MRDQVPLVWIPPAVEAELNAHPDPAALATIRAAIEDGWIQVTPAIDSPLKRILTVQLHRGEAEAIALAAERRADIVLIDEQEGRALAAQAGLTVTGVIGVLLRGTRSGAISAMKPEIDALRSKARFFLAASLEKSVLASAGES